MRRRTPAPAGPSGRSLRRPPPSSRPDPPRARQADARGSQGARLLKPRRQVDVRRPEFVDLCPVCLSLTRPLGNRLPRSPRPGEPSRLTNGVRGRGPHLSGSTAGGAAPYVSARGPILRGTPGGTRTFRHGARVYGKHVPWPPKAPRRSVGLARHCSAHATAARAGTSRARPSRISLTPHRRSRTSSRIAAQARPRDRGAGRPRKPLRD